MEKDATYTTSDKSKVYNLNGSFGLINYPGYDTTELTIDKIDDFYDAALCYVRYGFATLADE